MDTTKLLEIFFSTLQPEVRSNINAVTPEEVGQDYFLHISPDKTVKEYIPRISSRQAPMEDRTLPRVTVSPTLLGCFIGYSVASSKIANFTKQGAAEAKDLKDEHAFRQGWIINKIKFDIALKPTKELVYDQELSDEHWLVAYDSDHKSYTGNKIGVCFIYAVSYLTRSGSPSDIVSDWCIKVEDPEGIPFSKNHYLNQGCYTIKVYSNVSKRYLEKGIVGSEAGDGWAADDSIVVNQISEEEYNKLKTLSADLLSERPAYLHW